SKSIRVRVAPLRIVVPIRVYLDRSAGGHRHHRDFGGLVIAGARQSKKSIPPHPMHQQPEAVDLDLDVVHGGSQRRADAKRPWRTCASSAEAAQNLGGGRYSLL